MSDKVVGVRYTRGSARPELKPAIRDDSQGGRRGEAADVVREVVKELPLVAVAAGVSWVG